MLVLISNGSLFYVPGRAVFVVSIETRKTERAVVGYCQAHKHQQPFLVYLKLYVQVSQVTAATTMGRSCAMTGDKLNLVHI